MTLKFERVELASGFTTTSLLLTNDGIVMPSPAMTGDDALEIASGLGVPTDTAAFTLTSSSGAVAKDNFTIDLFEIPDVSSAIQSPSALLAGQRSFVGASVV